MTEARASARNITVAEAIGELRSQLAEGLTQLSADERLRFVARDVEVEFAISFKVTEGTGSSGQWFLDTSDNQQARGETKHKVKFRLEPRSVGRRYLSRSDDFDSDIQGDAGGDFVDEIVRNEDYEPPK